MGYRFAYGTGTFVINYWKMNPDLSNYSKKIDYAATNKKKKELPYPASIIYNSFRVRQ